MTATHTFEIGETVMFRDPWGEDMIGTVAELVSGVGLKTYVIQPHEKYGLKGTTIRHEDTLMKVNKK